MSRVVLMLAFHFPPFAQSTGAQRVLSFARQLPRHGWNPVVLTASENAYPEIDRNSLAQIPAGLEVVRAWVVDIGRRIAVRGRYPSWLATPDRWTTWVLGACGAGLRVIKKHSPAVLWATFPIPSALLAALLLHRLTGVPLVADLRDPIVYEDWPTAPRLRRVYGWIERLAVRYASAVVVTTPGALQLYLERYPGLPASRFRVIPNGIDDSASMTASQLQMMPVTERPLTLVHSGLMELPDRDPSAFFAALRNMLARGEIDPSSLRVVLRASGQEAVFRRRIDALGIGTIVTLAPRLPRDEAMRELLTATGVLLFQGTPCNRQIPAKVYEYLASRRPILGICDPAGDTSDLLRHWGVPYRADLDSHEQIEAMLRRFISDVRSKTTFVPTEELLIQHSRAAATSKLAELLNEVASIGSDTV
jgi:glycosyltransferase involved in cell wall biosynthesis